MFGLFDPPQTKAQKRAAASAQALREQAVRDMVIELRMLISRQEHARQLQHKLFDAGHDEKAIEIMKAVNAAQETIDGVGRFNDFFPRELDKLRADATNAAGFEAVASFELEAREALVKVREEAKAQLTPLGVMSIEARKLLDL